MGRAKGTGSVFQRAKDGKWCAQVEVGYTPSGNRRRITRSYATKDAAQKGMRAMLREIAQNGAPTTSRGKTVKAWSDDWLVIYEKEARPSTFNAARGSVRNYIVPVIGRRQLAHLNPDDVRKVDRAVRDAGVSSSTVLRTRAVLSAMLKAARANGHTVPDNAFAVKRPAASDTKGREAIPRDDAVALLVAAQDMPDASRWVAAMLNGMRPGECRGLTWECIDFDRGLIDVSWQLQPLPYIDRKCPELGYRVPDDFEARHLVNAMHLVRPKTSRGRRVLPMVPWLAGALKAMRTDDAPYGLVWLDDRGLPRSAPYDADRWLALQGAAKVRHESGRPYDLYEARHTTASLLLELGVDPHIVTSIMGHTRIATSRGYQSVTSALMRTALEQVADRLALPRA